MKGKWKVTSQYIDGQKFYAGYRLRDVNAVDHSGNREYCTEYTNDREMVQSLVDYMNETERAAK